MGEQPSGSDDYYWECRSKLYADLAKDRLESSKKNAQLTAYWLIFNTLVCSGTILFIILMVLK